MIKGSFFLPPTAQLGAWLPCPASCMTSQMGENWSIECKQRDANANRVIFKQFQTLIFGRKIMTKQWHCEKIQIRQWLCVWKWASVWRDVGKQRESPPAMKSTIFGVIRSKLWIGSIYSKKTEWYSCLLIFQTHSSRACKENTFQNWHGLFCGSCEPTQQRWILHFTWSSFPFQMREKNSQNYEYNKGIWYWIQPIIGTCQKLDLEHKKWAVESHY